MKRFIIILLTCAMLIGCLASCNIVDTQPNAQPEEPEEAPDPENPIEDPMDPNYYVVDEMDSELNSIFAKIQDDFKDDSRFIFYESFQKVHYEYKDSEKYVDEDWSEPIFTIIIHYDIDKVKETEWYKNSADKEKKTLNKEFYNYYSDIFNNSHSYTGIAGDYGFLISYLYKTNEEFMEDFDKINSIAELEYVTSIIVGYQYSVPWSTMLE